MAKPTVGVEHIETMFRSSWLHTALWSYVTGQVRCGTSVANAIRDFAAAMGMADCDENALRKVYDRKCAEFKSSHKEIKSAIGDDVMRERVRVIDEIREGVLGVFFKRKIFPRKYIETIGGAVHVKKDSNYITQAEKDRIGQELNEIITDIIFKQHGA